MPKGSGASRRAAHAFWPATRTVPACHFRHRSRYSIISYRQILTAGCCCFAASCASRAPSRLNARDYSRFLDGTVIEITPVPARFAASGSGRLGQPARGHSCNTPRSTLFTREHLWFPAPFEPHGVSEGAPSRSEPTSKVEEQLGHSQKNSEWNSGPVPFSH